MVQKNGYDIRIQSFVTTGDSALDFDEDGAAELTGAYGKTATIVGGSVTMDAPASFLISSDDVSNTILQGTRASLEVVGAATTRLFTKTNHLTLRSAGSRRLLTSPRRHQPSPLTRPAQ